MIYLIYGQQNLMLERSLKKFLSDNFDVLDEFNLIKLNAKEVLAQDIAYEASLLPIGYDRKAVVVYNPYFLSNEKEEFLLNSEEHKQKLTDAIVSGIYLYFGN